MKPSILPLLIAGALFSCHPHENAARSPKEAREEALASKSASVVGRAWFESLFTPGTSNEARAELARHFESLGQKSMFASLALALDNEMHGRPAEAVRAYVAALRLGRTETDPDTHLATWFASRHLLGLRSAVAGLYRDEQAVIDDLVRNPGNIGFRAVAELEEWWASDVLERSPTLDKAYDDELLSRMGCVRDIRIAGPFGHASIADETRAFGPESPGPWPHVWPEDPVRRTTPRELRTVRHHCQVISEEQTPEGVFYAETFVTTASPVEVILAVQGAETVWVDDTKVLSRSHRVWGDWQRFGTAVALSAGRHRIVGRIMSPAASIRVLRLDGTAADVTANSDDRALYSITPPLKLADPNPLDPFVRAKTTSSPLEAALVSYSAHTDSMDDVAAHFMDPIVSRPDAPPLAIALAAEFMGDDPAFPEELQQRTVRKLHERALKLDPELWQSSAFIIADDIGHRGLADSVEQLRALASSFPAEPGIAEQLARAYSKLGWHGEHLATVRRAAERFTDDPIAQKMLLDALDTDGSTAEADAVAERLHKLDPDSEVLLLRAVARHDWKAAVAELARIGKRHPDRREIAARVAEALSRSGDTSAAASQLDRALALHPLDAATRYRRADIAYADGDLLALQKALGEALRTGANTDKLRGAIDLLEGATDLEPYRVDGREKIREFEAWEKAGHHMDGNAARVLDYAATWVHPDGASTMLEHEIQRIQSQEAVQAESEIAMPTGLVLRLRVIKPSGAILEPEQVGGKPTLTLPHLEVGDYIEIEHIAPEAGDGQKGQRYRGPYWFFREADKGYWRSEFVVVTPKSKPLEIETQGEVGAVQTRDLGAFTERRWRVDMSPPSIVEPDSPPITEFLPTVRIGWGVTLETTLSRLSDLAADEPPMDPRIEQKAHEIVGAIPADKTDDRARALYRYVAKNIQDGKEADGRRVLFGQVGVRQAAFKYLLRAIGIKTDLAVAKSILAASPIGKMSEADGFDTLLLTWPTNVGPRFQMMRDKFAPYGFVPAEVRGQPAYLLLPGNPKTTVVAPGDLDRVLYSGRADVRTDGTAALDLSVELTGGPAVIWRNAFEQVPKAHLLDFVEREVIAPAFDGAHVRDVKVDDNGVDVPLVVHIRVDAPHFGKVRDGSLAVHPPLTDGLRHVTALAERSTPLLRRGAWRIQTRIQAVFPDSMKMPATATSLDAKLGDATITVKDAVQGHAVVFDRWIDIPAGRIPPGEPYLRFKHFVEEASSALERDVVVGL